MVHRFTSSLTCALFKVSFVEYECEMQTLTILGHDQSEASTETALDCVSNHLEVQGTLIENSINRRWCLRRSSVLALTKVAGYDKSIPD